MPRKITKKTEPIRVSEVNKNTLDAMKTHPRETYDDVLTRIIKLAKTQERQMT
jgi:hypothetical protein